MLRDRQDLFCGEYLIDFNATGAAIRAGYSQRTASSQGQRLLKDVEVARRIDDLRAERAERLSVNADVVVQGLLDLHQADVRQLFGPDGRLLPPSQFPEREARMVAHLSRRETSRGFRDSVRFVDRLKILELLGRHVGAFR